MDSNNNLKQLKESLAQIEKQYNEIKGDMPVDPKMDKYNSMMDMMYRGFSNLRDYIYGLESKMYAQMDTHKKGHLPPILGADKMSKALKTLGCDGDYEIQKPVIYARASRQGNKEFEVELNIPN